MRLRLLAMISCALLFAGACSDDPDNSEDTGGTDTGTDVGDTADTDGSGDADTTDGDVTDADTDTGGYDEAALFFECDNDDECEQFRGEDQICVEHVCVVPPVESAYVVDEEDLDNIVEHSDTAPVTDCYEDLFVPAGEDTTVTLAGLVERFGSGPTTESLCMTFYDETTLVPWMVNSECNLLADEDEDTYIGCFQLDPCRCDEHFAGTTDINEPMIEGAIAAMDAAGTPMEIDDVDSCYSFVGYCDGIEDETVAEGCRQRVAANGLTSDVDSLIFGTTITVLDPVDDALEEPEGTSLYSIQDVPTNWRYAVKVSGRENRWRDTWEYGHFTRGDLVADEYIVEPDADGIEEGVEPYTFLEEPTIVIDGTAVSAGAWATIPPAVGLAGGIDNTHGAVAGAIRDCGGTDRNPWAIVHGRVGISFNQGSVLSYFNGNPDDRLPNPARIDTNVLGTYAAIDLPPGPNRVAPVICLNDCTSRDDYVFAGAKNVFQTPKSVIIATFEGYFEH